MSVKQHAVFSTARAVESIHRSSLNSPSGRPGTEPASLLRLRTRAEHALRDSSPRPVAAGRGIFVSPPRDPIAPNGIRPVPLMTFPCELSHNRRRTVAAIRLHGQMLGARMEHGLSGRGPHLV